MKSLNSVSLIAIGALLSACGVPDNVTNEQSNFNNFEEAKFAADVVADDFDASTRLSSAPAQDTASMSGYFEFPETLFGEMTMEADFGAGEVSGRMHNAFLVIGDARRGAAIPLDGSINYSGDLEIQSGKVDTGALAASEPANTDIVANASNSFQDPDGDTVNVFADMFGDFHKVGKKLAVDGYMHGNITTTDVREGTDETIAFGLDGTFVVHE